MIKLNKNLELLLVSYVGNRVNLIAGCATLGGIVANFVDDMSVEYIGMTLGGILLGIGARFGKGTRETYLFTKGHIENFGKLDPRFLKNIMESENSTFIGYCEDQGAYLAARKMGELESFKEAKKKYSSRRIPNF